MTPSFAVPATCTTRALESALRIVKEAPGISAGRRAHDRVGPISKVRRDDRPSLRNLASRTIFAGFEFVSDYESVRADEQLSDYAGSACPLIAVRRKHATNRPRRNTIPRT